ncbi:MAG TPA: enoyl-CoA hydratase [Candidatus Dormibacteraeota bacterium]|nr:enoyl-CoA hydratase [Candidatus Dormibacteraeota bacterium]
MDTKTGTEVVRYAVENGVAWIRLNRPERMNAVNGALRRALADAVRRAEREEGARVVVVTGEGRAFCAGADVREFGSREGDIGSLGQDYEALLSRLRTMPKPTIAALNGVAAGIGASLALVCDLRYAVPEAAFLEAFVKIGLTVDGGVSWLLPRLVGTAKALEMFYTGDPLGAEEALRRGVVNRVVEPDALESTVREVAERLAAGPTVALGAIKRSVNHAASSTLEEAMEFEFLLQRAQMRTDDFKEGVSAFLEKRSPRFQGR